MITTQSQRPDFKPKKARLISDFAILNGFFNSPIWKLLFVNFSQALDKLCLQYFQATNVLLSYGWTSVTKMKLGSMAGGGIVQTLGVCCILLAYNSIHVWKVLSPLAGWFIVPLMPFFKTPEELYELAFVQIESKALVVYLAIFILTSLVHILTIFLGYGSRSVTSRGIGYTYLLADRLMGKYIGVNEFAVNMIEIITVGAIAVFLMVQKIDFYFGGWLLAMSLAEIRILLYEKTGQIQARRLLDV